MKKVVFFFLFLLTLQTTHAQKPLKNYAPTAIKTPDLSARREAALARQNVLFEIKKRTPAEEKELNVLLEKYGEEGAGIWNVISAGCSWYCAGGNYKITASSELSAGTGGQYGAKNANDLSYQTAWVEGNEGPGIGAWLEYRFKNESPRITGIIVANGYVKNAQTWRENNRVAKLRLYVNGKPAGILNLQDSRTDQTFEVGTLGRNKNGTDLVLRFEIAAVYPGDKYDDTAITEIYFDGIDVHK